MDDLVGAVVVALGGFFVVLTVVLLARYRELSKQISASSDLGHDLWKALEDRLRKQDERILDLMMRFSIVESRLGAPAPQQAQKPVVRFEEQPRDVTAVRREEARTSARGQSSLDRTESMVVRLLNEGSRTSVEIKQVIGKSREHTARLMKSLYERGLVDRNQSEKPFVYRLTDKGKAYLA